MKRLLIIAVTALTTVSCAAIHDLRTDDQPYDNPFYAKYLNTGSTLDLQITRTLEALRQNPDSAELHNTLGALLLDKKFPKDAEVEFERAVDSDKKYYQAWYNLGLVRAAHGDELGAKRAFSRTVDLKPGHSQALFQLGLVEEKNRHSDRAVRYYVKAFTINPLLLRVDVNPRILDSKLTDIAMLTMYAADHSRRSMQLQGTPTAIAPASTAPPAAAPRPAAKNVVTPAPSTSDSSFVPTPVHAPAAPARGRRSTRGRQPGTTPAPETAPPPPTPPTNQ